MCVNKGYVCQSECICVCLIVYICVRLCVPECMSENVCVRGGYSPDCQKGDTLLGQSGRVWNQAVGDSPFWVALRPVLPMSGIPA